MSNKSSVGHLDHAQMEKLSYVKDFFQEAMNEVDGTEKGARIRAVVASNPGFERDSDGQPSPHRANWNAQVANLTTLGVTVTDLRGQLFKDIRYDPAQAFLTIYR
eukprot:TRINITY_DN2124_c0_g1_i1.p4 TRINITY_DN2124_c0_g1~~TRINITY_DN2124_c0_g1_i1.p4  ORF type:complete len:105 (-),score=15.16 TRINITY_DN2124_c0_g1_i1:86-400(-)